MAVLHGWRSDRGIHTSFAFGDGRLDNERVRFELRTPSVPKMSDVHLPDENKRRLSGLVMNRNGQAVRLRKTGPEASCRFHHASLVSSKNHR